MHHIGALCCGATWQIGAVRHGLNRVAVCLFGAVQHGTNLANVAVQHQCTNMVRYVAVQHGGMVVCLFGAVQYAGARAEGEG